VSLVVKPVRVSAKIERLRRRGRARPAGHRRIKHESVGAWIEEVTEMLVARGTTSIEARLEVLLRQTRFLQRLVQEQHSLVAGRVEVEESRRRLSVANRINESCQRLEMDCTHSSHGEQWVTELRAVRALAESVLRENPVLQVRGPLHVIRSYEMPDRYVLNRHRRRELRKGFGLHRGVRNDEGPSVVVAFTPPAYEQRWHAHTVDEYTLALDTRFSGRYADGKIRELEAEDGELFHFHPHTYHALANPGERHGRTFTLKYPIGISVWLPALKLTGMERGQAEVRWVAWERERANVLLRRFQIGDAYHRYAINVAMLAPQARLDLKCEQEGYFYVLDGCVEIRRNSQTVHASADDLIVAEPTPSFRIRALTRRTRLYWASDIVFAAFSPGARDSCS